jgi:hypothetical protein
MKEILMIHEIREEMFDLPLESYLLTFDDGLYSQYYYWPKIKKLKTQKIFFISSGFFSTGVIPRRQCINTFFNKEEWSPITDFKSCIEARKDYVETNGIISSNYMSIAEINHMIRQGAEIGGHGHKHIKDYPERLADRIKVMKNDIETMLDIFYAELKDFKPKYFCFPFNIEPRFMRGILKSYGFTSFFGGDRIPIENLL